MSEAASQRVWLRDRSLDAIVIGGSAGVLDVLRIAFAALPRELPIPIVIVVHLPPRSQAQVHEALQPSSLLAMSQADDKEPLAGGHVYFAPPGYHLLIEANRCAALSVDEPVYYSRPSIDVLFESASDVYRRALLGILLTGASPDGAAGLQRIHERGGLTIVQDPQTCEARMAAQTAIDAFRPDYVLAPSAIASLLATLAVRESTTSPP